MTATNASSSKRSVKASVRTRRSSSSGQRTGRSRAASGASRSWGEEMLALHLRVSGIRFEREALFHPARKWRFDFCLGKLAVEVDGGTRMVRYAKGKPVSVGSHSGGKDYEKLNAAAVLGWRVLRFTPAMVKSGEAINTIMEALKNDF